MPEKTTIKSSINSANNLAKPDRKPISGDITLRGDITGSNFKRTFHITKEIGTGASVICYEANHKGSGKGTLKEFYPDYYEEIRRIKNNQLSLSKLNNDEQSSYNEDINNYIRPYQNILKIKQTDEGTKKLSFIPPFEIYYGLNNDNIVYTWCPNPEVKPFSKSLNEIRENPTELPEQKLVLVLKCIESLANCIKILHSLNITHCDIKPSNFGFVEREGTILPDSIELFDINSIYLNDSGQTDFIGTEEFYPKGERPGPCTDIYAIGVTLFKAIVIDKNNRKQFKYSDILYDNLETLIKESPIISCSESNSHPRLVYFLTKILKNSLCDKYSRYQCCEDFLSDLNNALYYSLPAELAHKTSHGDTWELKDIEKSLDRSGVRNVVKNMQYHLFTYPLYEYCENKVLNIAVLGFGNYGQKFLDSCLQFGQLSGYDLHVTVLTDIDSEYDPIKDYIRRRPEIGNFFTIEGYSDPENSYGTIDFNQVRLDSNIANIEYNEAEISDLFSEKGKPNYIFIALGNDLFNNAISGLCSSIFGNQCSINYVIESTRNRRINNNIHPLVIGKNPKKSPLYDEIERMAFNVHLLWQRNLNVDLPRLKKEFHLPYYHDASVSCIISIKYKLFSIGIDIDNISLNDAANAFVEETKKLDGSKLDILYYDEHRRWVTEKICLGFKSTSDYSTCYITGTKNELKKTHTCICRSRCGDTLERLYTKADWDNSNDSDKFNQLDELEQMSVLLHREYVKKANDINKNSDILTSPFISNIFALTEAKAETNNSFNEWYNCVEMIVNGNSIAGKRYKSLTDKLLNSANINLSETDYSSIKKYLDSFSTVFKPFVLANEYVNYKNSDKDIVDGIPFILTYSTEKKLLIPFSFETKSKLFDAIIPTLLSNPKSVKFLTEIKQKNELSLLFNAVNYVLTFINRKQVQSKVEFIVFYNDKYIDSEDLKHLKQIKFIAKTNMNDYLSDIVKGSIGCPNSLIIGRDNSNISFLLKCLTLGYSDFSIDESTKELIGSELQFIKKKPYITTDDLTFEIPDRKLVNPLLFKYDIESLWNFAKSHQTLWERFCKLMHIQSLSKDIITTFSTKKKDTVNTISYAIPSNCVSGAKLIVSELKKLGIIGQESNVICRASDIYRIFIVDLCGNIKNFNKAFNSTLLLSCSNSMSVQNLSQYNKAELLFNHLDYENIDMSTFTGDEIDLITKLLSELELVTYCEAVNNKFSFSYSSTISKKLLTNPNMINTAYISDVVFNSRKFGINTHSGSFDVLPVSKGTIDISKNLNTQYNNHNICFDYVIVDGYRSAFVKFIFSESISKEEIDAHIDFVSKYGLNAEMIIINKYEDFFDCSNSKSVRQFSYSSLIESL